MSIRPLILSLVLAAPLFAQAGYSINNSAFSCSAALSFANSTGLDAHCTGNFSVTGGVWTSDTKIALSADGSLTLDGVVMTAPIVELSSMNELAFLGDTLIYSTGLKKPVDGITELPGRVELEAGTGLRVNDGLVRTQTGSVSIEAGGSLTLSAAAPDGKPRLSPSGEVVLQNTSGIRFASDQPPMRLVASGDGRLVANSTVSFDSSQQQLNWDAAAVVPEPETYALALTALATLGASAARTRRRKV